ncbi:DUF3347 domain-containing protein [Ulvibacterium marinum]|jgi:hypothetical protein|uniref:DUF3347 domain-containing protein n=1 Tax=Ulvibacterium marinum TaxID=2419782 RepID=UPI0024946CB2|nr:DUF3347 domain-containing protein [Ulvibacterium marinum]
MKTLFKTTLILLATVTFISCKNESKKNSEESSSKNQAQISTELAFNDESAKAQFQHYVHIKTALVNSNIDEAKSGATMLMKNTDDANLKGMLAKISEASDIETLRAVFSDVTEQMTSIVNEALSSGEVYKQFCPMAFNNQGGYWLSTEKEIRNPYYGDKMLKCGRVTETIK